MAETVTTALRDLWKADAAVAAIVGEGVYRDELPQTAPTPALVLWLISDPRPVAHDGPVGFHPSRVQVDALAPSPGLADELAEAAIAAARRGGIVGGVKLGAAFVLNGRSGAGRPGAGLDDPESRKSIDLEVWWNLL